MKTEISSLELYYLIKELQVVVGSKIDRIYHSKENPKELMIGVHVTNEGKSIIKVLLPGLIFIDDTKDAAVTPTGLAMMLRKYLEGGRIKSISQKDFERVVNIVIESKFEDRILEYNLIVELFSKGNIIFCDKEFKILNIYEEQTWKDRTLKRLETYKYPQARINTTIITHEEFITSLTESDKHSLVKSLAIIFNLGGAYAEELCSMSNIDKDKEIKSLKTDEYELIYKNLKKLFNKEVDANASDENIFPFILQSQAIFTKKYSTFCEAIRENYDKVKHVESKKESNKNSEKIQNIIDEQEKLLEEAQSQYEENQRKGEILYEKYQDINETITAIKTARIKNSWKEIKQKIDENPDLKKRIKDIDEKTNSIIIELEDKKNLLCK